MSANDPQNIAQILEALKATTKLGAHLDHAQIWERWNELAGAELAPHSHPMKVRKGLLTVAVAGPVWMHKFSYDKAVILGKINRILTKEAIEDIYLTLPTADDLIAPEDPPE
jgi:predicted nucleic acid-binding Zn ribbon protein